MKTDAQQTKHTAGPWITETSTNLIEVTDSATEGHQIALIHLPDCAPFHQRAVWREQYMANARLIAAAPELLAVARMAVEWAEVFPSLREWEHVIAARAAIAKAEGRA